MAHELIQAIRRLTKSPGFALAVIVALALGIGAGTAIFSVANAAVLRWREALVEPERLAMVWKREGQYGNWMTTPADFRDWRARSTSFTELSAFTYRSLALETDGGSERVRAAVIRPGLLALVGLEPHLGRAFAADEGTWGRHRVAILSHGLWVSRYGADPDVLGLSLVLAGERYRMVGVMPPGAWFDAGAPPLFVPLAYPDTAAAEARNGGWQYAIGRLAPGVALEAADREMAAIAERIAEEIPSQSGWSAAVTSFETTFLGRVEPTLVALGGAVGVLLLLACVNVAALVLARAERRTGEMALRSALGARRGRLMAMVIAEGLVLSVAGAAVGLVLAWLVTTRILPLVPAKIPRLHETGVAIDLRVVAFAFGLSMVTALAFALIPALRASNPSPRYGPGSAGAGRGGVEGRGASRFRVALMTAEVASAALLLVGAGLLIRTLHHLGTIDLGVRDGGLLMVAVEPPLASTGDPETIDSFFEGLVERVEALPGVHSAGMTSELPLEEGGPGFYLGIEGQPDPLSLGEVPIIRLVLEGSRSHEAFGLELLRGRRFDDRDTARSEKVALIDERSARRFFPDRDPVGQIVRLGAPGHHWLEDRLLSGAPFPRYRIVGVTRNVRYQPFDDLPGAVVYIPYRQRHHESVPWEPGHLVVYTDGDPTALLPAVRAAALALDPQQPRGEAVTLADLAATAFRGNRFATQMLSSFAAVALILAVIGIYGVIAYSVARRRREIGVRMALGAERRHVLALVGAQVLASAGAGLALGSLAALGLSRHLESLLRGVERTDPATFAAVALVLLAVAAIAAYLPARRAAALPPSEALRAE